MRKALLWIGGLLLGVGLALIVASVVGGLMGASPSFNLGDPAKFQFYLVPLWQIGGAIAVVGGALLLASRWVSGSPSRAGTT
jgi:nitrate reductase gamma subunit